MEGKKREIRRERQDKPPDSLQTQDRSAPARVSKSVHASPLQCSAVLEPITATGATPLRLDMSGRVEQRSVTQPHTHTHTYSHTHTHTHTHTHSHTHSQPASEVQALAPYTELATMLMFKRNMNPVQHQSFSPPVTLPCLPCLPTLLLYLPCLPECVTEALNTRQLFP